MEFHPDFKRFIEDNIEFIEAADFEYLYNNCPAIFCIKDLPTVLKEIGLNPPEYVFDYELVNSNTTGIVLNLNDLKKYQKNHHLTQHVHANKIKDNVFRYRYNCIKAATRSEYIKIIHDIANQITSDNIQWNKIYSTYEHKWTSGIGDHVQFSIIIEYPYI